MVKVEELERNYKQELVRLYKQIMLLKNIIKEDMEDMIIDKEDIEKWKIYRDEYDILKIKITELQDLMNLELEKKVQKLN